MKLLHLNELFFIKNKISYTHKGQITKQIIFMYIVCLTI